MSSERNVIVCADAIQEIARELNVPGGGARNTAARLKYVPGVGFYPTQREVV